MQSDPNRPTVLTVERAEPASADGIVIGGHLIEVSQNHLLEPFLSLLASVEGLASAAANGGQGGPNEEICVRAVYCSLYQFFHTLLPSASHQAIDGLTYSASLLLVGEAIEAGRIVAAPLRPAAIAERHATREEIHSSSSFILPPSSFSAGRSER